MGSRRTNRTVLGMFSNVVTSLWERGRFGSVYMRDDTLGEGGDELFILA